MMTRIVLIFLLLCTPALAHDPSHPFATSALLQRFQRSFM
jgi:hypothetical protein